MFGGGVLLGSVSAQIPRSLAANVEAVVVEF
jgi:hypothetical protein